MIGVEVSSLELVSNITLVNIYGPCADRVGYWNNLFEKYFMKGSNLIVGGDLNLSLVILEAWCPNARTDPLADFFLKKLWEGNLIDTNQIK